MKHISKPWEIVAKLKNGYLEVGNPITEQTVCEVCHHGSLPLVMAAPELLEALKEVESALDVGTCDSADLKGWIKDYGLEMIRNVIAKAEGKED